MISKPVWVLLYRSGSTAAKKCWITEDVLSIAPRTPTARHCALLCREQGVLSNERMNFYLPPAFFLNHYYIILQEKSRPNSQGKKPPQPASEVLIAIHLVQPFSLLPVHAHTSLPLRLLQLPYVNRFQWCSQVLFPARFFQIFHSYTVSMSPVTKCWFL